MQLFARLLWTLVRTFNEADAGREWERERERDGLRLTQQYFHASTANAVAKRRRVVTELTHVEPAVEQRTAS